jgi:hypothetical protein
VVIAGWVLLVVGFLMYLAAFAQGAGPRMGDSTLQASLFTGATVLLVMGLAFLVVI